MTRERINRLIDLVETANKLGYATIQAEITIGKFASIHTYDNRFKEKQPSLSLYYETDRTIQTGKNPRDKQIITLYDPEFVKAERYLLSIIRWYEERGGDGD